MHEGEGETAEKQMERCVLGNWREGVRAIGALVCLGGIVSMAEDGLHNLHTESYLLLLLFTQFCR